jgi:2-polyprenyl-6-methoxyphenol hydroxylase-like FAD-dependent oxidoreductase
MLAAIPVSEPSRVLQPLRKKSVEFSQRNVKIDYLVGKVIKNHENCEITFLEEGLCDVEVKGLYTQRNVRVIMAPSFPKGKIPQRYDVSYYGNQNVVVIDEYGLKGGTYSFDMDLNRCIEMFVGLIVISSLAYFFFRVFDRKERKKGADVVMVGAGPVGLWTAILIKTLRPKFNIYMLEKYKTYSRTQTLHIELNSFLNTRESEYARKKWQEDKDLKSFLKRLEEKYQTAKDKTAGQQTIIIPIQDLESMLLQLAKIKGIYIETREVLSPAKLPSEFPNASFFIGSDGARSGVRRNIFPGKLEEKDLAYNAEVTYEVKKEAKLAGNIKSLSDVLYGQQKALKARLSMHNSLWLEQIDGTNPRKIILTFGISKDLYSRIQNATRKEPWKLSQVQDRKLEEDVFLWSGMKQQEYQEQAIKDSVRVTARTLSIKISKTFVQSKEGTTPSSKRKTYYWCLVGDAAASFPYRQGINFGIRCGTELSSAIAAYQEEQLISCGKKAPKRIGGFEFTT